ncbi:MAG: META domain-containing protein [Candidatus Limnocylindrales bacterium]
MVGNRTFVSTGVTGHQLVAGTKVTLTFRDATLSASAGCNSMSGEYHIVGSTLSVGSLATTEMGCQQDLMAQDAWLAELLPGATVQLGSTSLTVTKGGVALEFVDRQTTNLPLEATMWTVDGLVSGDAVSSVPQGVAATLVIRGREAQVYTGCNWASVAVTVADGTIAFSPMSMTARGCTGGATPVEQAVMAALEGVQPYVIAGDSLTIGTVGKAAIMLKGTAGAPSVRPG